MELALVEAVAVGQEIVPVRENERQAPVVVQLEEPLVNDPDIDFAEVFFPRR